MICPFHKRVPRHHHHHRLSRYAWQSHKKLLDKVAELISHNFVFVVCPLGTIMLMAHGIGSVASQILCLPTAYSECDATQHFIKTKLNLKWLNGKSAQSDKANNTIINCVKSLKKKEGNKVCWHAQWTFNTEHYVLIENSKIFFRFIHFWSLEISLATDQIAEPNEHFENAKRNTKCCHMRIAWAIEQRVSTSNEFSIFVCHLFHHNHLTMY